MSGLQTTGPIARGHGTQATGGGVLGGLLEFGIVTKKELMHFSRQLATLQDAGLPILRALTVLEHQQKPGPMRRVIREVAGRVRQGSSLADALAEHPRVFDQMYVKLVAAGEASGTLEVVLVRIADAVEYALRIRRQVLLAMIYPTFVLVAALGVVIFMMVAIVPLFGSLYQEMGRELPLPTRIVMSASKWFLYGSPPGWLVAILVPLLAYVAIRSSRRSNVGRYFWDLFKLKIPLIGKVYRKSAMARSARTLGTLIAAGVPVLESLRVAKDATGSAVFARAFEQVHDAVRGGEVLAEPLLATHVIDRFVVDMVRIGEETGDLDKMLFKVADNYEEEVQLLVSAMISVLKPTLIIILALIVGSMIIALYLPYVRTIEYIR